MKPQLPYFTTKTAQGSTFCNRVEERAHLKRNIEKGHHSVIVAPRRYGKTSLVCQTLQEMKVDYTMIDLFCTVYANAICEKIVKGVSQLVRTMVPFTEKALQFVETCFKNAYVTIKAGKIEIRVESSKPTFNPVTQILDILEGLEKLAAKNNKRVVVFIDEFQDLLKADYPDEIQAAIRSLAQKSQYICFIFSGSSRYMLKKIFEDRNQPLYMLCNTIQLERIADQDFKLHMQKAAKSKWKKELPEPVMHQILTLSELHPYYFNLLCDKLWEGDKSPNEKEVEKVWQLCLAEQKDKLISDLESLNSNRMKVLSTIALLGEVKEPNSKLFMDKVNLPLSSIQKALTYLIDYDYVYVTKENIVKLIDPLLMKFLREKLGE
jgi:AAA+ ATPase superfamily predicted ATPase